MNIQQNDEKHKLRHQHSFPFPKNFLHTTNKDVDSLTEQISEMHVLLVLFVFQLNVIIN